MTEYASADELAEGDLGDGEDFKLPSGKTVRIRGLTRYESMFSTKGLMNADGILTDIALYERRQVVACVVQPKLTLAQVEQWQRKSGANGDLKALMDRIKELSGRGEGADKSDLRVDGDPA
jgi:hypothetical protein